MQLEEMVVVVTGAGQGIGREIAIRCAAAGAKVVLAARSVPNLEETAGLIGDDALVVPTDVTDPDAVSALAAATADAFGPPDVLVNNSGIAGPTAHAWETSLADWQQTLDVNLTGPWLCARAVLPAMIERRSGSIINIGSVTGKRPLTGRTPYAATKAGLIGITRTLAEEVGPYGIRVNLVSPGAVEGPRIDAVFEEQARVHGVPVAEVRAGFEAQSPLRRLVTADDVAKAVVFLASDAASGVTGVDLNVTTGFVMY